MGLDRARWHCFPDGDVLMTEVVDIPDGEASLSSVGMLALVPSGWAACRTIPQQRDDLNGDINYLIRGYGAITGTSIQGATNSTGWLFLLRCNVGPQGQR